MAQYPISATGSQDLTDPGESYIGTVVLEVTNLTGSITPRLKKRDGSGADYNVAYANLTTGTSVSAGTAITADGIYEIPADACIVNLNVTSVTGTCTVYDTPLIGAAVGGSTSISSSASSPVFVAPSNGAVTEAAAMTITSGGSAQDVFAANTSRKFLLIVNTSDTAMTVRFGTTNASATVGVILAASGGTLNLSGSFVPSSKVTAFGATTGKTFYAVEG